MFWNLHGFKNLLDLNSDDFCDHLCNCAVLCYSESWLCGEIRQLPKILDNYKPFDVPGRKNKSVGRASGGIGILLNPDLVERYKHLSSSDSYIAIKFNIGITDVILVSVYINAISYEQDLESLLLFLQSRIETFDGVLIVGGDFNARVGDLNQVSDDIVQGTYFSATRNNLDPLINRQGKRIVEELESLGLTLLNGRSLSDQLGNLTFLNHGTSTIDLVWTNYSGLSYLTDLEIISMGFSDHMPVVITTSEKKAANITLNDPCLDTTTKITWDINKVEAYQDLLSQSNAEIMNHSIDTESLNAAVFGEIYNTIKLLGMERSINLQSRHQVRDSPWYDQECKSARRAMNNVYHRWCRTRDPNLKEEFLSSKAIYASLYKKKKSDHLTLIRDKLSHSADPKTFWCTVRGLRRKTRQPCPIDITALETFYANIFPPRELTSEKFLDAAHPYLDAEISIYEVKKILKNLKNDKSPGPDGIANPFYRYLPENFVKRLTVLFNKVFDQGCIPQSWCNSDVILLYKKGDLNDPLNYRGIALTNTISKIFTTLISSRLKMWAEQCDILPEAQSGFREGRACEDNIFILQAKISVELSKTKGKLYAAFIDFRRAFDSVVHSILWKTLREAGVSSKVVRVLQDLYQKANMRIKLGNNMRSETIDITQGVLQGDALSPLLFSLFLYDIIRFFKSRGHTNIEREVDILLFADDLVLTARDIVDLQAKLDTLNEYIHLKKLEVNVNKTVVMKFTRSGRPKKERRIKFNNIFLEVVRKYTYLGVVFSSSGSFRAALDNSISKGKIALGAIWSVLRINNIFDWVVAERLFIATVTSTLLYCSGIWGLNHTDEFEKIHMMFYKRLLQLPTCTPGYILRLETGLTKLESLVAKRALRYWVKLLKMKPDRFPQVMYLKLKQLYESNSQESKRRRNWVYQLYDLLQRAGHEYLLRHDDERTIKLALPLIDSVLKKLSHNEDVEKATRSRFCPGYKYLKDLSCRSKEQYLSLHLPSPYVRIFAACRMSNRLLLSVNVNKTYHTINTGEICTLCNLNEKEDLKHILNKCPMYDSLRIHHLKTGTAPEILRDPSKDNVSNVFYFFSAALKRRAFILDQSD